jgi:hypothetical protein
MMDNLPFHVKPYYVGCNCVNGHISTEGTYVDGVYFSHDDWWVAERCKNCNMITVVGSENLYSNSRRVQVEGKTYVVLQPKYDY